nr:unnamed protein product [Callosobruchus chinensis]
MFNRVISTRTIRRRILASGLRCKRPLRVPLLTARHRTARLQWAKAHQDWLLPQWRNVLFSDKSRFGLIPGIMTGAYYLQNITNAIVQPLRNEIGDQCIFMDDNARPHRTRAVQQGLENENIARLEWQELIVAATEEWNNIPQEVINNNLIIGMHRRADALIRSRGGNAKY